VSFAGDFTVFCLISSFRSNSLSVPPGYQLVSYTGLWVEVLVVDIRGTDRIKPTGMLGAGHPGRQSGLTVLAEVAFENLEVRVGDVARADNGVERGRGRREEWAGNGRGSENLKSEGGEKVGCFESRTEVVSWPSQYFPGEKNNQALGVASHRLKIPNTRRQCTG